MATSLFDFDDVTTFGFAEDNNMIFTLDNVSKTNSKNYDDNAMPEYIKLELIRIIGFTHLRLSEGCATMLQLDGCLAKMCELVVDAKKAGGYSSELGIDAM